MRSKERSWRYVVGVSLLAVLFVVSLVLLALTEQRYKAFRETLQRIQFAVRLESFEHIAPQEARLRWIVTVTTAVQKIPMVLELLDWRLSSADGSTHLGFYTSGEIQLTLTSVTEVPVEAVVSGPHFEKLQRLQEEPGTTLLFQGMARVMFQLPRREERKKIPVVEVFMLPGEEE